MLDAPRAPGAVERGKYWTGPERLPAPLWHWFARSGLAAAPRGPEAKDLLYRAEVGGERVAAGFRFVIFLTLLSVVSLTDERLHALHISSWTWLYGLGTLIGLGFAWRGVFHPVIPYLFVTFDVLMIGIQLLLLTRFTGMPASHGFALPVASLVFVIMVHASMRYRPWLVVYAAALFITVMQLGALLLPELGNGPGMMMGMAGGSGMGGPMLFQVFPIAIISLSALILFVIGRRTRRLLLESIEQTSRATRLARFFSPRVAERLAARPDEELLRGTRHPAAVLFVDIRGFTAMAEMMEPNQLGAFLSEFRGRLAAPVFRNGGSIDKFIGDAALVVFGVPLARPDDAARAVTCALQILDGIEQWSDERERAGLAPVKIGIGAHYGEVFAGALGNQQLLEYTVIGDTVNVAERLERLTREVERPFLISGALRAAAGETGDALFKPVGHRGLRGHAGRIETFAVERR
jgi:adenylate cyclase